eukprot:TRINITY_DN15619_c0_g1_i1.p1 TRINITY_DN15619_c0_g1~~TRINITY_DN15619_c0_g1_i1.p1  ORF type:complete len:245 (-),score=34.57 TRINITY_DN15619_c0_g1_i1:92-826(-)
METKEHNQLSSSSSHLNSILPLQDDNIACPSSPGYINILAQNDLFLIHAALMFISFFILMPFGIFISRYLRHYLALWFPLHILIMLLSAIFAISSFVLATSFMHGVHVTAKFGPSHSIIKLHHRFGYAAFSLLLFQLMLGMAAHVNFNDKRKNVPWVPDRLHWVLGWSTVLVAGVAVTVGGMVLEVPSSWGFVWGGYWVGLVVILVCMEVFVRMYPPGEKLHQEKEDRSGTEDSQNQNLVVIVN